MANAPAGAASADDVLAASLVGEEDSRLEGSSRKKVRLARRNTEEQADRCIAEHF